MEATERNNLIQRIKTLEGLTDDERSALLGLLRETKTYGLVWEDKPEYVEERLRNELPVLVEDKKRALTDAGPDAPNHILIEGDNLEALTTLTYTHAGKIDVIYIDPPYNTGNKDFVYNDSFIDAEDSYRHSKWLSFMARRLRIGKKLLSERGAIFISIDENEYSALRLLMDEIFLPVNYRNTILVKRRTKSLNSQFAHKGLFSLNVGFEYIVCYSRTNSFTMRPIRQKKESGMQPGKWQGFWSNADRPSMRYEILGFTPTCGQWRNKKEKADEWIKNYQNYIENFSKKYSLEEYSELTGIKEFIKRDLKGKGQNGGVYHWVPPTDSTLRTSNWTDIEVSQIQKEFDLAFNNPKSKKLMMEVVKLTSIENPIVLDFFAGSGTTLHAVMQLNAEDGGKRQCILCTNNENGICENVTYERNKRVIEGYTKPNGEHVEGLHNNNLRYYRTEFVSRDRSVKNMRRLVSLSTDMLCIKEDLYSEQKTFAGMPTYKNIYRYFEHGDKKMLIIYDERYVDELVKMIATVETASKIKVYVFSPSEDPWEASFEPVNDKVELCALPQAIYNAYKRVLPKRKEKPIAQTEMPTPEEEEIGGLFAAEQEGGEE